jgi:hypothetical protein
MATVTVVQEVVWLRLPARAPFLLHFREAPSIAAQLHVPQ